MMRSTLIAAALCLIAGVAFAQETPHAPADFYIQSLKASRDAAEIAAANAQAQLAQAQDQLRQIQAELSKARTEAAAAKTAKPNE